MSAPTPMRFAPFPPDKPDLVLFQITTGLIVAGTTYTGLTWNTPLSEDSGKLDAELRIPNTDWRRLDLRTYTAPWKYGLAAISGTHCYWAGPISVRGYDSGNKLKVTASDVWQLFNMRGLLGNYNGTKLAPTTMDTTFRSATVYGLAREIVAHAMNRTNGQLPMILPDEEAGTTEELIFRGYEPKKAGEALAELAGREDGPEVMFRPLLDPDGNRIMWELLVGRPLLDQTGADIAWHTQGSNVRTNIPMDETAELYTTVWATGNGQEREMKSARADNPSLLQRGYPAMDYFDTGHTDDSVTQDMLNGYAKAAAKLFARPVESTSITVGTTLEPTLASYRPGFRVALTVEGHPWLGREDLRHRIRDIKVDAAKGTAELTLDTAAGEL